VPYASAFPRGDGSSELANLVTACARCQYIKGSWLLGELGWQLRPIVEDGWNGLTDELQPLLERLHNESALASPSDYDRPASEWVALDNRVRKWIRLLQRTLPYDPRNPPTAT